MSSRVGHLLWPPCADWSSVHAGPKSLIRSYVAIDPSGFTGNFASAAAAPLLAVIGALPTFQVPLRSGTVKRSALFRSRWRH
jgi:hypothetical protein